MSTPTPEKSDKPADSGARKFLYRGYGLEELKQMNMKNFVQLLPSRMRRSSLRGMPRRQKKLLKKLKRAKRALKDGKELVIRTHNRDMIIYPEFIGLTIAVHNGLEFISVKISPEHIGHYLGEYAPTCKQVKHGNPGVGATKSSQFVPLK
jgi:small subunit ribosomal protein S19